MTLIKRKLKNMFLSIKCIEHKSVDDRGFACWLIPKKH